MVSLNHKFNLGDKGLTAASLAQKRRGLKKENPKSL
jgi:hypothetical protein